MRWGGMSAPRRKVEVGGLDVNAAQSSGEWPGGRITLREGLWEGGSVDIDALVEVGRFDVREGGRRRVDAAEGGGANPPPDGDNLGRGLNEEGWTVGGGIRELGVGCRSGWVERGGGIAETVGFGNGDGNSEGFWSGSETVGNFGISVFSSPISSVN